MAFCSDVDLRFTNGTLPAGKSHICMISSVLRGAIETHNSNSSTDSSSSSSRMQIGMDGVSTEEWMQVARFLYPVPAPTEVQDWQEAELLLRVGAQFDMPLLLQAADRFMVQNTPQLVCSESSEIYLWKWLKLADHHGLQDSVAAIAAHAVKNDREGCIFTSSLEQLSWSSMRELVGALVPVPCLCSCHCPGASSSAGASCRCSCRSPPSPCREYCPCSPRNRREYYPRSPSYRPTSPSYDPYRRY
jgi:hypothetical protein